MHQKVRNPVKPELHIKYVLEEFNSVARKTRQYYGIFLHFFSVQLTPCDMEVDMSIVDRITALLNRPSFLNSPKAKFSQMYQVRYCYFQSNGSKLKSIFLLL